MADPRVGAGTIVARNYLPAAKVLAGSFRRTHPGTGFTVLVVDADPAELGGLADEVPGVRFLGPADTALDPAEFGRMALAYTVTELSTAVKPWLLRALLDEHDVAVYLDPDIEVFAPFAAEAAALAVEHGIVLTPHVLDPMPRDGLRPSEADIMASGVFNLGFIAVGGQAAPFLRFWADRLRQDAISSVAEQLFTDQRWVDNVPALFGHVAVTDPGWNVAYWNVYQRPLARAADGSLTAAGRPLRFAHYSGHRPEVPWLVSTHFADRPRVLLADQPVLADLLAGYRSQLIGAGYREALADVPYRWDTLPDGAAVTPPLRRLYRAAWIEAERAGTPLPPNPLAPGAAGDPAQDLIAWACTPATADQARAGLSRWAVVVWDARPDLQQAFPHPLHADAAAFRRWCQTSGVDEGMLPAGAVEDRPARGPVDPVPDLGVNVLGYLTAELGVGELGRLVHEAVVAGGLPVATAVEETTVVSRTEHPLPEGATPGEARYGVSVLVVNADMTAHTLGAHPDLARDRYVIGVWSWELDTFPPAMRGAFDHVDEVWTPSDFCTRAIAEHSPVPVRTVPVPVRDPLRGPRAPRPTGPTRFLFAFDHMSVFARKNPLAAITAFRSAFPDRDDVRLVVKTINGDLRPGDRERLRFAAAADDRVELVEGYLSAEEVAGLFAAAHAYVSPHRSEGFGFTVAEAMAHGLAVVATDYGGTAEFLTPDTGWPVPHRLVPVGPGSEPYPAEACWADPLPDALAAALREIADDPGAAARKGAAAREHVLATRSPQATAEWVRAAVEAAHATWLARRAPDEEVVETMPEQDPATGTPAEEAPAADPLDPLRRSREALRWRADPAVDSRLPMAAALRRGVLRALDHYDHHQRQVLGALLDGVDDSAGRLVEGQRALLDRVRRLEAAHAEQRELDLAARLDRLERLAATLAQRGDAQRAAVEGVVREVAARPDGAEVDRRVDARAAELGQRLAELEHRLVGMMHERVGWMTAIEAETAALRAELPRLRTGLLRHHDLVDPGAGGTEVVMTDVGPLRLPAEDTVVLPWLREYGTWEAEESRLLDVLLPAGGTLVDIGAHVGYFTVRGLRRVGAAGRVVAVEPWERARELLRRNVAANTTPDVAAALTVVAGAAWDADGPLRLALSAEGNTGDNRIDPGGGVEVPGVRLATVLGAGPVHVVKSDAQGRDHRALAGLGEVLRASRPHVLTEFDPVAVEEAGSDPVAVLATYRGWGYAVVPVTEDVVAAAEAGLPVPGDTEGTAGAAGAAGSDEALVGRVRDSGAGFATLWLRPRP
ncbi:FkbM family methyltransferase [Actinokineospora bangkokensis]|uniref:Methyltransferase FkbM domain-containing protein n=1 Tax=Actinokineospora bangkokensis TaxID=1193682 RepID=A0A1Q9LLD0_9PSEU|nr:FkbM family methyltransferase [Actinokineospora bangkokensis]OLR92804.1 hypothetical protein BJP25_19435 [Actinokineospora bangkokensis]